MTSLTQSLPARPSMAWLGSYRKHTLFLTVAAVAAAAWAWHAQGSVTGAGAAAAAFSSNSEFVAKVNGEAISRTAFERVWTETRDGARVLDMQENRQLVLDSVVGAELLAQQARKDSTVMDDPQLQAAMELQRRNLLANAYAAQFLKRNPVTDAQLKLAHEQFVKDLGKTELRLRHILLARQPDAQALHARIERGEITFAKALEQTEERLPDGSKATGELGWVAEGRLAQALRDARKGATGTGLLKPYADQFGWHIVSVEETRPLVVPSWEQARSELIPLAQRNLLRDHLAQLKLSARISH